VEKLKIWV